VNKTELVKELAKRTEISQAKASDVIDALFDANSGVIAAELGGGGKVVIPGFGSFFARKRAAREARNPATGATRSSIRSSSPARPSRIAARNNALGR